MPNFNTSYLLLTFLPLALAGCVSSEDQQAMDQDKCVSYGYRQGTDRFADCMMGRDQQRADDQSNTMASLERQDRRDRQRMRDMESSAGSNLIDTRPQFDKDGNPNFDAQGNYQGCHGVGCMVDNPDN